MGIQSNLSLKNELLHSLIIHNKVLTHVNPNKSIVCKANTFLWNIHGHMEKIMNNWMDLWDRITEMEEILYDPEEVKYVLGSLYACLNISKTEEFSSMTNVRLTTCLEENKKE